MALGDRGNRINDGTIEVQGIQETQLSNFLNVAGVKIGPPISVNNAKTSREDPAIHFVSSWCFSYRSWSSEAAELGGSWQIGGISRDLPTCAATEAGATNYETFTSTCANDCSHPSLRFLPVLLSESIQSACVGLGRAVLGRRLEATLDTNAGLSLN